jgi:hypothetical protein
MAENVDEVELGTGKLYLNAVDVGYLSGDVTLTSKMEMVDFKPSISLGPVKSFPITELVTFSASSAQLSAASLKLALGTTTAVDTNTSFPADDPSSFTVPASASFNVLTFGGSREVDEMSLRYEGTRSDGTVYGVVLYNVKSNKDLTLAFKEKEVILIELAFTAMAVTSRAAGDQIGFYYEQATA